MTKIRLGKHCAKLLVCTLLVAAILFVGCQKQKPLPQPQFPLSKEELTALLEEAGLSWTIEQTDHLSDGIDTSIAYSLHRPESGKEYNTVFITSFDSQRFGRRLKINFREPQNKQWWLNKDKEVRWEDWREMLVLVARLYGGFEDTEEIYRACSAVELPKNNWLLWEGTLTGGYFRMTTENDMKPERLSMGNTVIFDLYESEDAYLRVEKSYEKYRQELNIDPEPK